MRILLTGFSLLVLTLFVACNKDNELEPEEPQINNPSCTDGIQNGDETGVDCGGSNCSPCEAAPSCTDGIQNGDETGVDCGGSNCPPCETAPSCTDGIQNGDETGVDCGGSNCPPCETAPSCTDGIQNGDETGVDCGGSNCPPCEAAPSCTDGIQNGDETGIDCGGSDCPPCSSSLSMMEYLSSQTKFSMLVEAIERAGFESNLEAMGTFTLFAPNNDAWQALLDNNGWSSIDNISPAVLNILLETQFSVAGTYTSDQFETNFQITVMYQNKSIHLDMTNPASPKVIAGLTSAIVVSADNMANNGVIHETNAVLLF